MIPAIIIVNLLFEPSAAELFGPAVYSPDGADGAAGK